MDRTSQPISTHHAFRGGGPVGHSTIAGGHRPVAQSLLRLIRLLCIRIMSCPYRRPTNRQFTAISRGLWPALVVQRKQKRRGRGHRRALGGEQE